MSILGNFYEDEFSVMQPQQTGGGEPPENPEPPDDTTEPPTEPTEPTEPTDEDLKEVPLKTKEQIIKDLEKAGIDEHIDDEGADDEGNEKPFDIKDGKKDDGKETEGGDKPEEIDDKSKTKEGKKQQADKLEEEKLQEKIQNLQTKNFITTKINQYNEILLNKDDLPNKVKETLNSAIKELEEKRNLINI